MKRAILTIMIFFFITAILYAQQTVGKIIQLVNDVDVTSLTTGRKEIPAIGFQVHTDHKIRTGKRSYAEILLNNGTRVLLKDISVLNISSLRTDTDQPPTRLRLLTGKVRVSLKKSLGKGHTLVLKTPTAIAGVRGTDFGVIASLLESKIVVFEGSLDIASSSQNILKSYQLKEREESDIAKDRAPTRPRVVPVEMLEGWFERYDVDESNRIIDKNSKGGGFLDELLRKRIY